MAYGADMWISDSEDCLDSRGAKAMIEFYPAVIAIALTLFSFHIFLYCNEIAKWLLDLILRALTTFPCH